MARLSTPEAKEKKRIAAKKWREKPEVKARKKELYSIWVQKPGNKEMVDEWREKWLSKPGNKELRADYMRTNMAIRRASNPKLMDERTEISRKKPENAARRKKWVQEYNRRPEVVAKRMAKYKEKVVGREAKDRINERLREYRLRPEVRMRRAKYAAASLSRARLYGCFIEKISPKDVYARDGYKCFYCSCSVIESRMYVVNRATIDHKTPLSRGGPHSFDNCVTACAVCNSKKGAMTEREFVQKKGLCVSVWTDKVVPLSVSGSHTLTQGRFA